MEDRTLTLTLDNGNEVVCDILFTYHDEERDKNYVVFQVRESGEVSAAIYNEKDELSGSLDRIETEEEWEMLEELLDEYSNQDDAPASGCSACNSCSGSCAGCTGCDDIEDGE